MQRVSKHPLPLTTLTLLHQQCYTRFNLTLNCKTLLNQVVCLFLQTCIVWTALFNKCVTLINIQKCPMKTHTSDFIKEK